jgi:hypothetical protein
MTHEIVRVISVCTRDLTRGIKMCSTVEIPCMLQILIRIYKPSFALVQPLFLICKFEFYLVSSVEDSCIVIISF